MKKGSYLKGEKAGKEKWETWIGHVIKTGNRSLLQEKVG